MVFSPGYVHPDEFFQAQEVAAVRMHSLGVDLAWEFKGAAPCRAGIVPYLSAELPYRAATAAAAWIGCSPPAWLMLVAPRLLALALSLLVDVAAARLASVVGASQGGVLLTLATAWPMFLLHTRPFSNTYESVLFALLLVLALAPPRAVPSFVTSFVFGGLLSLAVFFRFTILLFALPLLIPLLTPFLPHTLRIWLWGWSNGPIRRLQRRESDPGNGDQRARGGGVRQRSSWRVGIHAMLLPETHGAGRSWAEGSRGLRVGGVVVGGVVAAGVLIFFDSVYFFQTLQIFPQEGGWFSGRPVVTPLNSLLYNFDSANLATHGLHPRLTHLVVNLPMLFGPLFLAALFSLLPSRAGGGEDSPSDGSNSSGYTQGLNSPAREAAERLRLSRLGARATLGACCASGLLFLSLAPHQEPRFLLPLTLPLTLLFSHTVAFPPPITPLRTTSSSSSTSSRGGSSPPWAFWRRRRRSGGGMSRTWLVFNAVMLLLFAGVHQGGVTRALLWLAGRGGGDEGFSQGVARGDSVVWFRTYMPPVASLLLAPTAAPGCLPPAGPRPRSLPLPGTAPSWSIWLQDTMQDAMQDAMDVTGWGSTGQGDEGSWTRWFEEMSRNVGHFGNVWGSFPGFSAKDPEPGVGEDGKGECKREEEDAGGARVGWGVCTGWRSVDLGGAEPDQLERTVLHLASPPWGGGHAPRVWVVAPASAAKHIPPARTDAGGAGGVGASWNTRASCTQVYSVWGHLSLEDPPWEGVEMGEDGWKGYLREVARRTSLAIYICEV